jgi:hypothetical protein
MNHLNTKSRLGDNVEKQKVPSNGLWDNNMSLNYLQTGHESFK